jgi:SAM-dependent methyltransferase
MEETRAFPLPKALVVDSRAPDHFDSPFGLVKMLVRQACHEARVRGLRKVAFRSSRNDEARRAYASLALWEFEGINERQAWANWRTIRRNLDGRAPRSPVQVIDLCCGTGRSTEVLAYYLEPGSRILGVDADPRFVAAAGERRYLTREGSPAHVTFHCQSVLEPLRDAGTAPVPDSTVDVVNSSGAVGCHFEANATTILADEVARVLRPGGLALIDCGPDGTRPHELHEIFEARGFQAIHRARSCPFDRYWQVCFRKVRASDAGELSPPSS